MIAIIDYGMGNIHSVNKALEVYGAKTLVTNKPADILRAEKAVLPGVGAFDGCLLEMEKQGLVAAINVYLGKGRPFLGICLGMQILFETSEEGKRKGLGVFKGKVLRFEQSNSFKVPHMGWNNLRHKGNCPLLKDIPDNSYVYFCHSYYPAPKDKDVIAAACNYGTDFAAVVWQKNIYGVQFHPEKSQKTGLAMIKNFVQEC